MIQDWNIDEELNRVKRKIEDLEVIVNWSTNIDKSIEVEDKLKQIHHKLKEI